MSVSTIGTQSRLSEAELAEEVKRELGAWFGRDQVAAWKLLRSYRIPFAQPNQVNLTPDPGRRDHSSADARGLEWPLNPTS